MVPPVPRIDYARPADYRAIFPVPPVRTSVPAGWGGFYFERREDGLFRAPEHVLEAHFLMVKLSPLSLAERSIDGRLRTEVQRRGCTAFVPAGAARSVRYLRPLGALCLVTLPVAAVEAAARELDLPAFAGEPAYAGAADPFLLNLVEAIDRELQDGNPHGPLFGQTYARLLAAHVAMRHGTRARRQRGAPALATSRLRQLDDFVEARLAEPIGLPELAREAGLSPFYFTRLFKAATGLAPYQYLLHKRIDAARRRLAAGDGRTLAAIGADCGFADPVQFAKQFRRVCGMSPSGFRAQARLGAGVAPAPLQPTSSLCTSSAVVAAPSLRISRAR